MTRHYKDYVIEVNAIEHWSYDKGFHAVAYIPKTDGTKADIREFSRYSGIKNQKEMIEYVQKLLEK